MQSPPPRSAAGLCVLALAATLTALVPMAAQAAKPAAPELSYTPPPACEDKATQAALTRKLAERAKVYGKNWRVLSLEPWDSGPNWTDRSCWTFVKTPDGSAPVRYDTERAAGGGVTIRFREPGANYDGIYAPSSVLPEYAKRKGLRAAATMTPRRIRDLAVSLARNDPDLAIMLDHIIAVAPLLDGRIAVLAQTRPLPGGVIDNCRYCTGDVSMLLVRGGPAVWKIERRWWNFARLGTGLGAVFASPVRLRDGTPGFAIKNGATTTLFDASDASCKVYRATPQGPVLDRAASFPTPVFDGHGNRLSRRTEDGEC